MTPLAAGITLDSIGTDETDYRTAEDAWWARVGVERREEWLRLGESGPRLRAQVVGEGSPVVFVAGASNGGSSWASLAAGLSDFRCILLDRPGCGLSQPLASGFDDIPSFATYADSMLVDVLDGLEVERASLVSTSLGGYFALRAAAAHPDRIERVVHLGWTIGAPAGHLPLVMRLVSVRPLGRMMARMPVPDRAVRSMLEQIGLRQALAAGRVPEEFVDWFAAQLRFTDTALNDADASPPLIHPISGLDPTILFSDELLGSIRVPVHFIWGADDPFGGADVAGAFAPRIPGATLDVVDGGGHAVWLDDPDRVAVAVRQALAADD